MEKLSDDTLRKMKVMADEAYAKLTLAANSNPDYDLFSFVNDDSRKYELAHLHPDTRKIYEAGKQERLGNLLLGWIPEKEQDTSSEHNIHVRIPSTPLLERFLRNYVPCYHQQQEYFDLLEVSLKGKVHFRDWFKFSESKERFEEIEYAAHLSRVSQNLSKTFLSKNLEQRERVSQIYDTYDRPRIIDLGFEEILAFCVSHVSSFKLGQSSEGILGGGERNKFLLEGKILC